MFASLWECKWCWFPPIRRGREKKARGEITNLQRIFVPTAHFHTAIYFRLCESLPNNFMKPRNWFHCIFLVQIAFSFDSLQRELSQSVACSEFRYFTECFNFKTFLGEMRLITFFEWSKWMYTTLNLSQQTRIQIKWEFIRAVNTNGIGANVKAC